MSVSANDTDIVITGDTSGYVRSLQEAHTETSRLTQSVGGLGSAIGDLHSRAKQRLTLIDAAATAGITAATASAAKLEQQLSQLEARSKLLGNTVNQTFGSSNQVFQSSVKAVGDLRREFGMASSAATQLLTAMNAMGATGNQAPQMARSYARMSAVTGESVSGLATEQNQLMRGMNQGRVNPALVGRYSSMAAGLSAHVGAPATDIMGFANRVAPLASAMGMTSPQVMGYSAAFQRAGQDGIAPATAFNKILADLNYSRQWGGQQANQYAGYIGVDPQKFGQMSTSDIMSQIFQKIGREGPEAARFLDRQGLDGVRVQNAVMALSRSGDLAGTLKQAESSFADTSGYEKAADAALSGLNDETEKVAQTFGRLSDAIGGLLLPSLTKVVESFNLLVGKPVNAVAGALEKTPGPVKWGIGTAAGIGVAGKLLGGLTGAGAALAAGGLASIPGGAAGIGYRNALNPGAVTNQNAAILQAGTGTISSQIMHTMGAAVGGAQRSWRESRNPVKDAENEESEVAKITKEKASRKERVRTEQEERIKVNEEYQRQSKAREATRAADTATRVVPPVAPPVDPVVDAPVAATEKPKEPRRRGRVRGTLRRGANFAMNMTGDVFESATDPVHHRNDYQARARDRAMFGSAPEAMYRLGGYESGREGIGRWIAEPYFQRRAATHFGGDYAGALAEASALQQAPKPFAFDNDNDSSLRSTAWKNAKRVVPATIVTAPRAVMQAGMAGGGKLLSGLGGLAMAHPMGVAIGAASMAAGPILDKISKEGALQSAIGGADTEGVKSSSQALRESLGLASAAVRDFAKELRDNTGGGDVPTTIARALEVTDEDVEKYGNRPELLEEKFPELVGLKPGKEKDRAKMQDIAVNMTAGARSVEEIAATRNALLATGLRPGDVEDMMARTQEVNNDPELGAGFDSIFSQTGDKKLERALAGRGAYKERIDRVTEVQGKEAADSYARQAIDELVAGFNDGSIKEREFLQTLEAIGIESAGVDMSQKGGWEGFKAWVKNEDAISFTNISGIRKLFGNELTTEDVYNQIRKAGGVLDYSAEEVDPKSVLPPLLTSSVKVERSLRNSDANEPVGEYLRQLADSSQGTNLFASTDLLEDVAGRYKMGTSQIGHGAMLAQVASETGGLGGAGLGTAYQELDRQLGVLVNDLKNTEPGFAEFLNAMRGAAREIQSMDMSRAGRTDVSDTGGLALSQLRTAYSVYRANPSSDTATEELTLSADAAWAEAQKADEKIRSGWHGFYNQDRNEARGWRNFARSKRIATENRSVEIGWQRSDRAQQVGWQEEDFSRSMRFREEDFQRSRRFQEEDFQLYRVRGWENFDRQRLREEDNYQRQRGRAEEDYQRQLYRQNRNWNRDRGRQEEDFQRGRLREEEDFNHRIEQMAKQTARTVFDVYSRVGVERTWSVQNLLQNMADQQRYLDEQLKNLTEARRLGLSDQAIETMGLADSSKAQQLQRIVDDLRSTPSQADAINKAIQERLGSSSELMQDESNSAWTEMMYQRDRALAQQLEDYERGRERSQEDYRLSLAESLEDFRRSLARQDEDRRIALAHSNEDFRRSMEEQLEDYERNNARSYAEFQRQTKRTNEEHARSMARSNELFEESLSRSEYLFKRSLDQQADDMKHSYSESRDMLNEQLEFITISTDQAYTELNKNLQGKTKEQFAEYKKTYDNIVQLVRQVKGAVEETYGDLTLPMPVASGSTGRIDPKVHQQIGGPETGSEKGLAGVLGSSGGEGTSGSHNASPARGGLSQGYHAMHQGIDIAGSTGDPVQAARGGVVSFAGDGGAYGRFTKIRHDSGMETWYGHQSIQNVVEGQEVSPGQVIGRMGDTGKSTGPHLHFEVRLNGQPIDPTGWAAGQGMGAGGFGGPDLERTLKRADLKGAFGPWEKGIDKTHLRPKIKRDATAKWWEDKIRQAYEDHYGPEMDAGFYSGSAGLGGVVRPVPQAHSGWNGGRYRSSGKWHGGLDFPAPKGTPIRAMWPGRVIKALRLSRSYGHHAQLDHGGGLSTLYAHMSRLNASVGQNVNAGDVLGLVGSTGNSTGNHLHLEVRVNGKQVDPTQYLTGKKTAGKSNVTTVNGKLVDVPTLNLMRKAEGHLGQKYTVTQGVKRPATSYSGSTHTGLGVLDMLPATERGMNALRRVGAASWLRLPWEGPWNSHLHTVFPVAGLARSAYNQYQNYLRGYNGLGKKDRYPFVQMDDPTIRTRASVGGYAGGTPNAAAGLREVGEHGMEIILGRGLKKFLGGEQVLNPLQTRRAFHSTQGHTPQNASGPAHITYDHSMRVDKVEVVAQNPEEMRNKLQQRQRFGALTGARG